MLLILTSNLLPPETLDGISVEFLGNQGRTAVVATVKGRPITANELLVHCQANDNLGLPDTGGRYSESAQLLAYFVVTIRMPGPSFGQVALRIGLAEALGRGSSNLPMTTSQHAWPTH